MGLHGFPMVYTMGYKHAAPAGARERRVETKPDASTYGELPRRVAKRSAVPLLVPVPLRVP